MSAERYDDSALIAALTQALLKARWADEPVRHLTRRTAEEGLAPALLPVVRAAQAAELRRIAPYLCTNDARDLLARADELDGGAQ